MRIWHDQLLHTKRSFGVVLYSQVQIAEFHPGLKVCHKSKYTNFTCFTFTLQCITNISKQTFITLLTFISNYIYRKKLLILTFFAFTMTTLLLSTLLQILQKKNLIWCSIYHHLDKHVYACTVNFTSIFCQYPYTYL